MCTYFEALTSNNMEEIKKITNDQYYSSLSLNNFFNNCEIKNISNVKIEKREVSEEYAMKMMNKNKEEKL